MRRRSGDEGIGSAQTSANSASRETAIDSAKAGVGNQPRREIRAANGAIGCHLGCHFANQSKLRTKMTLPGFEPEFVP